ncbi:MAG: YfiR family protein [Mucilaginibacter sp.]|nr:YfiR family protein [Mucilaginibacter sp.]
MIAKRKNGSQKWAGCLLLLIVLSGISPAYAQTSPSLEYRVKAAFLFNFTRFVHWPASAYTSPDDPFVIGIVGSDPFGSYLDELVSGESAGGHKIVIRRYPNGGDIRGCQLIFINLGDKAKLKLLLAQSTRQNVLTVSDENEFIRLGGIVHFYMEDDKVKMEVRPAAAKAAQLEISAKLLQVAKLE